MLFLSVLQLITPLLYFLSTRHSTVSLRSITRQFFFSSDISSHVRTLRVLGVRTFPYAQKANCAFGKLIETANVLSSYWEFEMIEALERKSHQETLFSVKPYSKNHCFLNISCVWMNGKVTFIERKHYLPRNGFRTYSDSIALAKWIWTVELKKCFWLAAFM